MLLEIAVVTLMGTAVHKVMTNKKGIMTNERRAIYDAAMKRNPPLSADQYIALSAEYDKQGLPSYADALRKRAALLNMPQAQKDARQAAIKKLMGSQDSTVVRVAANLFEHEGAFGTSDVLRQYADSLDQADLQAMLAPPPPPPAPPPAVIDQAPVDQVSMPISGTVSGGIGGATQASSPESATPSVAEQSAGVGATAVKQADTGSTGQAPVAIGNVLDTQ